MQLNKQKKQAQKEKWENLIWGVRTGGVGESYDGKRRGRKDEEVGVGEDIPWGSLLQEWRDGDAAEQNLGPSAHGQESQSIDAGCGEGKSGAYCRRHTRSPFKVLVL